MLIFLFIVYVLAGGSGPADLGKFYLKQAREYVGNEVKDPAREKAAKAAAKEAKKGILTFLKQTMKSDKAFRKLVKDPTSTPEQFDALLNESLARQREAVTAVFAARQALLKSVTPGEWSAIVTAAQRENAADARKAAEKAARKAKAAAP